MIGIVSQVQSYCFLKLIETCRNIGHIVTSLVFLKDALDFTGPISYSHPAKAKYCLFKPTLHVKHSINQQLLILN